MALLSLSAYSEDLLLKQNEKGKFGFAREDGTFIVEPVYDQATEYVDGISRVCKGNSWGLLGAGGELITPVKYANIGGFNKYGLAPVNVGGKSDNGAVSGGKFGFINRSGEEVLPLKYTDLEEFDDTNTAWVKEGSKYGLIDSNGTLLAEAKYVDHGKFGENEVCWINVGGKKQNDKVAGGKFGYINTKGVEVVPATYLNVRGEFVGGLTWIFAGKDRYGVVNSKGVVVLQPEYENVCDTFSMGIGYVSKRGLWGYVDKDGMPVTEIKYNAVFPFRGGMAPVGMNVSNGKGGFVKKYGYVDETGREVIPLEYEDVSLQCYAGKGFIKRGGKWAYADKSGKLLTDFIISGFSVIRDDGYVAVCTGDSFDPKDVRYNNYLDNNGRILNDKMYNSVSDFYEGYACVQKADGKYCWIDRSGNECFDDGYDMVGGFSEGLAFAQKNGEYRYINREGKDQFMLSLSGKVIGCMFSDGHAYIVRDDKKWGCIDNKGDVIVPVELDSQDDAKSLYDNAYMEVKRPLGRRAVNMFNLYKNVNKCSIGDRLSEQSWCY